MSRLPAAVGAGPWHVVDAEGLDPATGRRPGGVGAPSPAAALAAVPVPAWPVVTVTAGDVPLGDRTLNGRTVGVAEALGRGGRRIVELLDRLTGRAAPPAGLPVDVLLRSTPGGRVDLPLVVVDRDGALAAVQGVDREWMAIVEERRAAPRSLLAEQGRQLELEAALNLAMLLATEAVDAGDDEVAARTASGARLWLLGGAVGWALLGGEDPFAAWAELVSFGLWPIGPAGGRLVVCGPARPSTPGGPALVASDR